MKEKICYLCNKPGANSRDHIPPKGLFNLEKDNDQRWTLPAHEKCNTGFSEDEEYFRDVIIQNAEFLYAPNIDDIRDKVWRSWGKSGWNRYLEFMKTAKPVEVKIGSIIKNGLSVTVNEERLKRIAIKIARGIVHKDTGAYTLQEDYNAVFINIGLVRNLKERDKDEFYWRVMNNENCMHTIFGDRTAARRIYIYHPNGDPKKISCLMSLVFTGAFYLIVCEISVTEIINKNLKIIMIAE